MTPRVPVILPQIEKDVAIPPRSQGDVWGLERLSPGDSFSVATRDDAQRARMAMGQFTLRHPGVTFCSRKMPEGGYRIWRLK